MIARAAQPAVAPQPIAVPTAFVRRARPGRRHRPAAWRRGRLAGGLLQRLADDRQAQGLKLVLLLACLAVAAWLEVPL
ncbi:MAG: hypothetical protein QN174_11165 [Armatimonadota bacterium]|nr:hypothetical protein [Armatimonadota bacterium]MDR7421021.1 hypothetical protein [Armatimonadota bacterium]MDR7453279.1 hypothetical protein [Armatimonadota bacterium]MDR7457399.1 hypothetical protein [Armatimonadota bacterium]MDR7497503.1 hypothetical protein [Armatimonadota bacterium]